MSTSIYTTKYNLDFGGALQRGVESGFLVDLDGIRLYSQGQFKGLRSGWDRPHGWDRGAKRELGGSIIRNHLINSPKFWG